MQKLYYVSWQALSSKHRYVRSAGGYEATEQRREPARIVFHVAASAEKEASSPYRLASSRDTKIDHRSSAAVARSLVIDAKF